MSWLLGIARRCVDDVFSARAPLVQTEIELESVDQRALEPETIERLTLRAAVVGLDPRSQELIALR